MSSEIDTGDQREGAVSADHRQGIFFVISSPSGGGKGTLIRRVLKTVPNLGYSISWTTRAPRVGEQNGRDYHFVSLEDFEQARARGEFLEWAMVHGNYYGTSRSVVEREITAGRDVVLEIDVQGAANVRSSMKDAVSIFILPPSFDVLRDRLSRRKSENPAALVLRLRNARHEVEQYCAFDYVVLNDEIERAAEQLASIIHAERARRERQEWLVRRVLATFPGSSQVA